MMLCIKYQRPGPSAFRQEDFFPIWVYVKKVTPSAGPFLTKGYNLNNFSRGPLDEATYQISKTCAFWFQTRRFFKFSVKKSIFSSCDLDLQWTATIYSYERGPTKDHSCEVWSKSKQWFRRRCRLKKLFTDARTHGHTHARRTKCDHKSSPCHYMTGELKNKTCH